MSRNYRLVVIPDGIDDDEDWRFFAPGAEMPHLVIEAGAVAAESFS
ncbi:hypothetical protein BDI4_1200001 [Burkholderia diffusa]|nr:hypothetical protein BDI4_1200001 [Burkholderia diffusa]